MNKYLKKGLFWTGLVSTGVISMKFIFPVKEKTFQDNLEQESSKVSFSDKLRAEGHKISKNLNEASISDDPTTPSANDSEQGNKKALEVNKLSQTPNNPPPSIVPGVDSWSMTKLVAQGKVPEEIEKNLVPTPHIDNDNALFEGAHVNKAGFRNADTRTFINENNEGGGNRQKIYETPKLSEIPKTKFARQAKLSGQVTTLTGMVQSTDRASMFKAGTRVLALLPDKLTVSTGEAIYTSLTAFGSTDQKIPNNLTFVGKAKLNKPERRVEILIDSCVNTRDNSPPIPCQAIVKDILGDNGLTGKIYDPSNWQLIVSAAGAFINTYILSTLTTSATQNGVAVDQTTANQVKQAMSGTVNSVANRLISSMDQSGREIKLAQGAIVQVFFTDSTPTWNDEK